jgi:hypothetical protein
MTTSEFLQEVNDSLRGIDNDVPTFGTAEALYWLRIANRVRRSLYKNPAQQWASTYQVIELGTVSASSAPTFDVDDEVIAPASSCYVLSGTNDDVRTNYTIVKPQEASTLKQEVYIAGGDPQTLYFTQEIASTEQVVGGTLYLPAYVMPDDFGAVATEVVIVDDIDWLVLATAAELAFSDITYEERAPDLNDKANAQFKQMSQRNRRNPYGTPKTSPYSVQRISSPHGRS